jgi:hypothetical protein
MCKKAKYMSAPWRLVTPHISYKSRQGAGCASTRCHISCSFGSHLPTEVSSGADTCPAAPSLSLLRWASAPPRVPHLQTSHPCWVELRRCHVSHGPGSRLLTEVSSGAATCLTALDSDFLRGELRCCHVSHSHRRAVDHRNKEMLSCHRHTCLQGTLVRYWCGCKRVGHHGTPPQCSIGLAKHS